MKTVHFSKSKIETKCVAIVKFGPPTDADGMRPAEFYQVTIDPSKCSPSGEYIRFGTCPGDEITGWQRAAAMSVIEILGEWTDETTPPVMTYGQGVTMMVQESNDNDAEHHPASHS